MFLLKKYIDECIENRGYLIKTSVGISLVISLVSGLIMLIKGDITVDTIGGTAFIIFLFFNIMTPLFIKSLKKVLDKQDIKIEKEKEAERLEKRKRAEKTKSKRR